MHDVSEIDPIFKSMLFDSSEDERLGDDDENVESPVRKFLEDLAFDAALAKGAHWDSSWDAPLILDEIQKQEGSPIRKTMASKLGIVRTTVELINGERWTRGYDAAGELVDARVL